MFYSFYHVLIFMLFNYTIVFHVGKKSPCGLMFLVQIPTINKFSSSSSSSSHHVAASEGEKLTTYQLGAPTGHKAMLPSCCSFRG